MRPEKFVVRGECLVNADDLTTAYRPLSFWFQYFYIEPVACSKFAWRARRNTKFGYIDVFVRGGYGLAHDQYDAHKDELYYCGNADLDRPALWAKL